MAIKDPCEHCGQVLSVPEDMRGKKVRCPSCGSRSLVLTPEDRRNLEDDRKRKLQEDRDRERLQLLERMGTPSDEGVFPELAPDKGLADRAGAAGPPNTLRSSMSAGEVEQVDEPGRDPADLLAFSSYLIPLLALASGLFPLVVEGELGLKLGVLGLCITLGLAGFTLFHALAELARRMEDLNSREPQEPLVQESSRASPSSSRQPGVTPPSSS